MNGRQRIVAALLGEWPDRVPVMLHNFPMAAREAGYTQRQYREDPIKLADSFIRSVEKYGKTDRILGDMLDTGADGLELDYKTDIRVIHAKLKDRAVFIGNIDPSGVLALGTPALVERKTRELLEVYADSPRFILNAGCAIPSTTPPDNLKTMIRVAREFRP